MLDASADAAHGLGRIAAPDPRDHRFLLANNPRAASFAVRRNHLWPMFNKPLDQGNTGTCVGHGWKHWLMTAPVIQANPLHVPSAFEIYDGALPLDEFPDNDHDTERAMGTSVRAGAKVLQGRGHIGTYNWAFDADTCADWLCGMDASGLFIGGPVVIGVNWYRSMFDTDAQGFLRIPPDTPNAGGHCVMLSGWNESSGFAYGVNSWGPAWGHKGRFYMPGEVLERLIHEDGEVCTAAELRILPAKEPAAS